MIPFPTLFLDQLFPLLSLSFPYVITLPKSELFSQLLIWLLLLVLCLKQSWVFYNPGLASALPSPDLFSFYFADLFVFLALNFCEFFLLCSKWRLLMGVSHDRYILNSRGYICLPLPFIWWSCFPQCFSPTPCSFMRYCLSLPVPSILITPKACFISPQDLLPAV